MRVMQTERRAAAIVALAILLIAAATSRAATLNVPAQYATISQAVAAAVNGDEILVAPGTYADAINTLGKAIAIRSTGGPDVTTVQPTGPGVVILTIESGETASTVIEGLTFTGADVNGDGGAFRCIAADPVIRDCRFVSNAANIGGGAYLENASPRFEDCLFQGNLGHGGGGGVFVVFASDPDFINTDFIANSTGTPAGGGGVVNTVDATGTFTNCRFINNTADNGAGMLNNFSSSPNLNDCVFIDNVASNWGGGMINWNDSDPDLIRCTFRGNEAEFGGAVFNFTDADAYFFEAVMEDNVAAFSGGAVANYDNSDATFFNGRFTGNQSVTGGGAMLIEFNSDVEFIGDEGPRFINNVAGTSGGAIMILNNCFPTLNGGLFEGNSAGLQGGAIICDTVADLDAAGAIFRFNVASRGGAVFVGGASPTFRFCEFHDNTAANQGGAISSNGASPRIRGCVVRDNDAFIGGGLHLQGGSPLVVSTAIHGNSAASVSGGVHCVSDTTATLANLTVHGNDAVQGGGLTMDSGASSLVNSIVRANSASSGVDHQIRGAALTVNFSNIEAGYAGPGADNIDADPLFNDPAAGDFTFPDTSPVYNAGSNTLLPAGETLDLLQYPRIGDAVIDMGAVEFRDPVHRVPADFATIQDALDFALDGETIVVDAGIYNEAVVIDDKSVTLTTNAARGGAVIDATGLNQRALTATTSYFGDPTFITIEGFTITGGNFNNGAGVFTEAENGSVVVRNCIIEDNHAPQNGGGVQANINTRFEDCIIRNNSAGTWGGGARVGSGFGGQPATFRRCIFTNNSASAGAGAQSQAGYGRFIECDFIANTASTRGGAASVFDYGTLEFINCNITDNDRGGVFASFGGALLMDGCLVARNTGLGGVRIGTFITAQLTNCTIVDNQSNAAGGGLSLSAHHSFTDIDNCIVWGNDDTYLVLPEECAIDPFACGCDPFTTPCDCENRPDICFEPDGTDDVAYPDPVPDPPPGAIVANNSCFGDGWPGPTGTGNIDLDPQFIDPLGPDGMPASGDENYGLSATSPCIDIGDASVLITSRDVYDLDEDGDTAEYWPIDLAGNERLRNGQVDAGAFEAVEGPTHSRWIAPATDNWSNAAAWDNGVPATGSNAILDSGADGYINYSTSINPSGIRVDNGLLNIRGGVLGAFITLPGDIYGGPLQIGVWSTEPARFELDLAHILRSNDRTLQIGELGSLGGNGTIDIDIENGGSINPGGVGTGQWLTINADNYVGRYTDPFGRETVGDITIDLISSNPPPPGSITSSHDVLNLGPNADLNGGSLTVVAAPGLNPPVGAVYEIVRVAFERNGVFDVAFLPGLPGGKFFRVEYDYQPPTAATGTRGTTPFNVFLIVDSLGGQIDFNAAGAFSISGLAADTAVGDFDNDGDPDCALAIPGASPASPGSVLVLYNGGTTLGAWNGWTSSAQFAVGRDPVSLDVGELDGDPGLDLAVLNRADDSVTILGNDGTGLFTQDALINDVGDDGRALVVFDADGDTDDDIVLTALSTPNDLGAGTPAGLGMVTIIDNGAAARADFGAPRHFAAGDDPGDIDPGDFDNDKDLDVALVGRFPREVRILTNQLSGGAQFNVERTIDVGAFPVQLQADDLNGDGLPDIVTGNRDGESVSVIFNRTTGPAIDTSGAAEFTLGGPVRSIVAVDLDSDGARGNGDLDLAVITENASGDGVITILRNDSSAMLPAFTNVGVVNAGDNVILLDAADIDGDGEQDLITISDDVGARTDPTRGTTPDDNIDVLLNDLDIVCAGDADGDDQIDFNDLNLILDRWGDAVEPGADGDVTFDGQVNFEDLNLLLDNWGAACG